MICVLRLCFLVVLASMLCVTSWASLHCPLFAIPSAVATHPWFIATLADAYWGFFTFFIWVAYKQTAWSARVSWFVAIVLLGNIAMAAYCLNELFRVNNAADVQLLLIARRGGSSLLGSALAITGIGMVALAVITS